MNTKLTLVIIFAIMVAVFVGCSDEQNPVVPMNALSTLGVYGVNGVPGEFCTILYAGQDIDAGSVCVEIVDEGDVETLYITFNTTGGWELVETHLWVGEALADMPQTRKGNPKIGNFPYQSGDITSQTTYTFEVDLAEFGGEFSLCGAELFAAAHAALQLVGDDGTVIQTETGWGNGDPMVERGNWATFFGIEFTCGETPIVGVSTETAFAYDCVDALCFIDIPDEGINRWGWTNGAYGPGTYYLDIYAGAGQCDITKGTLVGLLTVDYDGTTATVTYNTCGDYTMTETHLYVGIDILAWDNDPDDPGFTVAPGQYPYIHEDLGNAQEDVFTVAVTGDIYVVAHAVVWGDYDAGDCAERGCVPPCVPGFDFVEFAAQIDANNNGSLKFKVTYPSAGNDAYFTPTEIDYDGDGTTDFTTESWCIDTDHTIGQNNWYCAVLYSSYDYPSDLDDTIWENLDLVNFILNQGYVGTDAGGTLDIYTYGDVQRAIWTLVDPNSDSGLGSWSQARVDIILADAALVGPVDDPFVSYEPPCDGVAGVIIKPVNCSTGAFSAQLLVAQVLVAEYPSVCTVCP